MDFKDPILRKMKRLKRKKLFRLLNQIETGQIDSSKEPKDLLFRNDIAPRQQYISPKDRDSYNYGYMEPQDYKSE